MQLSVPLARSVTMTKKQEFYNSFEDSDGELANRMYAEESPLVINKAGDGEHGGE